MSEPEVSDQFFDQALRRIAISIVVEFAVLL
jgi:hypothetical protein